MRVGGTHALNRVPSQHRRVQGILGRASKHTDETGCRGRTPWPNKVADLEMATHMSDVNCRSSAADIDPRIVRTNGLPIEMADGSDVVGVYSRMSRFNHSCVHNAPRLHNSVLNMLTRLTAFRLVIDDVCSISAPRSTTAFRKRQDQMVISPSHPLFMEGIFVVLWTGSH